MQKYIHEMDKLPELFDKLSYESLKFWASYTAMMFEFDDEEMFSKFWDFLLHYLRISDTVFKYSKKKYLVILEETTLKWALLLNDRLREKIEEKWFGYKFHCSAVQGNFIDEIPALEKTLKKRLKKAKECGSTDCVHTLSCMD